MRVIVEVDTHQELQETLERLGSRYVTVVQAPQARSASERQEALRRVYARHEIRLPDGWKFDRDEAHER